MHPASRKAARSLRDELDSVRREHARLQQTIYEAAQIQRRLCAPREISLGRVRNRGRDFPGAPSVRGFFQGDETRLDARLTVGDIAGKGLSAGIWQAHLMDLIQRCARTNLPPAEVVAAANQELCRIRTSRRSRHCFLPGSIRRAVNLCTATPACHLHCYAAQQVGGKTRTSGPMLGALKESRYDSGRVRLNPGDLLLAYSDGLTECRNSLDEEFEMERLTAAGKAMGGGNR